jgi:ABC-type dipeptide/oligopeptide/nickel transport system permease subunit
VATGGVRTRRHDDFSRPSHAALGRPFIRKQPLGVVGLVLVLIVVLAAIFARPLARYGPAALSGPPLTGSSGTHWSGTDDLAREAPNENSGE